ncbi:conjugal transfer protein TraB [Paraburkholderia humisilvae]|nr:conjugal transfer protein TraB [Paraburkholderia humisilvae]
MLICRRFLFFAIYGAAGAAIALIAWYPGHWLIALLVLPVLWAKAPNRWAAGAVWAAYYIIGARDIPVTFVRFFTAYGELSAIDARALGVACWLAQGAVLAAPWVGLKPELDASPSTLTWRAGLALLLVSLPPLGIIGWLSPLQVAGTLYPGTRWLGLVLALLLLATIAAFRHRRTAVVAAMLAVFAIPAHVLATTPVVPDGWLALDTQLGKLDQADYTAIYERTNRVRHVAQRAFDTGARVVVLPEEIVGLWRPSSAFWWQRFASDLKAHGQTLVLGVDLMVQDEPVRYSDSAVVVGYGSGRLDSRQPVPAGMWRPGAAVSAVAGAITQGFLAIDGRRVAVSICFEDYLVWPHWRLLIDRPDVLVGLSNGWFNSDLAVSRIQSQSVRSIARLAGVPLVRAVNQQSRG